MDVLYGIFGESDILLMPVDTLALMSRLIDLSLAKLLEEYISSPEANPEVVAKIDRVLGKSIRSYTYVTVLKDKGIIEAVSKLKPYSLPDTVMDYDENIKLIEYVKDIKDTVNPYIEPRKKEDYLAFIKGLEEFDKNVTSERKYANTVARVQANSALFYTPREKAIPTAARVIVDAAPTLDVCLKGIKYLKYCDENHIIDNVRRNF